MSSTSHLPSSGEAHPSPSPSDNDVLIRVEGVSKIFCRDFKKSLKYGLMDSAKDLFFSGRKTKSAKGKGEGVRDLREREFYAVKDVSFEVRRGECLGLIGHNGAGKTTLLKMLNGLIKPDSGRIEMRGRVGALIALGAGFNPLLTGRENIYVNGSVLGLTRREVDEKIGGIIEFSEIGEFIDSPVQTYSSGMQVRLGFAVATAMEPEVLLLDEVLAVGDFQFRMKCFDRISKLLPNTAVLFVSHQLVQIRRMCTHGIHLKNGEVLANGEISVAAASYESEGLVLGDSVNYVSDQIKELNLSVDNLKAKFMDSFEITCSVMSVVAMEGLVARVLFITTTGEVAGEWDSRNHDFHLSLPADKISEFRVKISRLGIMPGMYKVSLVVSPGHNRSNIFHVSNREFLHVEGPAGLFNFRQL